MSKWRWFVLIFGPLPIVAAAMALTAAVKSGTSGGVSSNEIIVRGQSPGTLLAAEAIPARSSVDSRALAAACNRAAAELQGRLGEDCQAIVRSPFVIAGDMTAKELEAWHRQTIEPAANALAHSYFKTAPDRPITILLFQGEKSYNHYAKTLFDESGISVYGYYKPNVRTLVMNIGTGGGTLVHELTHALIDFDFPDVPAWFNEGLASLHEQCRFRDDAAGPWIEGLENWRLGGLQETVRRGRLRSLQSLISGDDFRGRLEGANYAQARYFCLYMQRQGVLRDYFRLFRQNRKADPQGLKTVAQVFPGQTWPQLDEAFNTWVLTLKR